MTEKEKNQRKSPAKLSRAFELIINIMLIMVNIH